MSSTICFNLDQFKILSSGNELSLSSLLTTQQAFVDSVDQDQTAQNVQSDFFNLHCHSSLQLNCFFILQWKCIFSQGKTTIYLFGSVRVIRCFSGTIISLSNNVV